MKKINLTNYQAKAVLQLLNFNKEFLQFFNRKCKTVEELKEYLNNSFILTDHQIEYICNWAKDRL